jgi:hypothetical protein
MLSIGPLSREALGTVRGPQGEREMWGLLDEIKAAEKVLDQDTEEPGPVHK